MFSYPRVPITPMMVESAAILHVQAVQAQFTAVVWAAWTYRLGAQLLVGCRKNVFFFKPNQSDQIVLDGERKEGC
jgi:hypothetical protein